MGTLFFKNQRGNFRLVKNDICENDVPNEITHFVYKLNPKFNIHYIRIWGEEEKIYDVGSHTEFFYFKNKCCANCKHFLGGGDFGTCCSKNYNLFYENDVCENWEEKYE